MCVRVKSRKVARKFYLQMNQFHVYYRLGISRHHSDIDSDPIGWNRSLYLFYYNVYDCICSLSLRSLASLRSGRAHFLVMDGILSRRIAF